MEVYDGHRVSNQIAQTSASSSHSHGVSSKQYRAISSKREYTDNQQEYSQHSTSSSSHFKDFDDGFLDQQGFIEEFFHSNSKDDNNDYDINNNNVSYKAAKKNQISVKSIKGSQSLLENEKHIEGFQKVTVASGPNRVNHFSRTISDDSHNTTDEGDETGKYLVEEDLIDPVSEYGMSGERSLEKMYGEEINQSDTQDSVNEDDSFVGKRRGPKYLKDQPIKINIGVKHDDNHDHADSPPKNKSFEEVTYRIPMQNDSAYEEDFEQHDQSVKIINRSPRDQHPDYEDVQMTDYEVEQSFTRPSSLHVVASSASNRSRDIQRHGPQASLPVDIDVSQYDNNRKIRVVVSPNPLLHQQAGFVPVHDIEMNESEHHHQHERNVHQPQVQVIKFKPTAIRDTDTAMDVIDHSYRGRKENKENFGHQQHQHQYQHQHHHQGQRSDVTDHSYKRRMEDKQNFDHNQHHHYQQQQIQQQQLSQYQQEHQRRLSNGSEEVKQIKRLRKSSLPNGFDEKEFRRQTDLQLQRQRDLQQKMLNRQQNESRGMKQSEYYKQQQYHQQKLMQHQQHLQRIQQQQQYRKQQEQRQRQEQETNSRREEQETGHDHVVLNGRVMRRHSFDSPALTDGHLEDNTFEVKERPQTRERRLSYEHEKSKLEEELQRLQEIEFRKHQAHQHQQSLQQNHQTTQFMVISNKPTSDDIIPQNAPNTKQYRKNISLSASNTPSTQRRSNTDSTATTPTSGRKRGKIPNSLKNAFQSEDIINGNSKLSERRRSNPNIILGRTDIKTQNHGNHTHYSSTLPRSFGRHNKKNKSSKSNVTAKVSEIKRSHSLNSSTAISQSTSVLDDSRLNQAQQRYMKHVDQVFAETKTSSRSGGQKQSTQQHRNKTTQEILAEATQAQRKQQVATFDDTLLNIINGSHVKQQETKQSNKKTSTFQFLFKKSQQEQKQQAPPPKPRRNQPRKEVQQHEEDNYQSIKVSAKGGVITLVSEKEHEKVEVSDQAKKHLTFSMYGGHEHQQINSHQHINHHHGNSDAYYQYDNVHNRSDAFDDSFEAHLSTSTEEERKNDTYEGVYYTVCTYFFHPEKNDWIQKIHRMGRARVPRNKPHYKKCVFLNHLDHPDREEIVVHKLLAPKNNKPPPYPLKEIQWEQSQNKRELNNNNVSWVDQAFSDAYDSMSEREKLVAHADAGTTFSSVDDSIFDTAFDARSIDSQSTVIDRGGSGYNITKDYSRYIQQKINISSENN